MKCFGSGGILSVVTMTCRSPDTPPPKQPFRRGCSRVYYASEDGCWPAHSLPRDFWKRGRAHKEEKGEETLSSGEDAQELELSLEGSFTGSLRGSPSQRSQDSGYSDSGESTNAQADGDNPSAGASGQPSVKHITRIYFGENLHLYNDKIVSIPASETKTSVQEVSIGSHSPSGGPPRGANTSSGLEELAEELEHKSVLEVSSRPSGPVRKWGEGCVTRRPQRCNSTVEKAAPEGVQGHPSRPATGCRTRRRWSMGEMQPPGSRHRRASQHALATPTSAADRKCNPDLLSPPKPWSLTDPGRGALMQGGEEERDTISISRSDAKNAALTANIVKEMRNPSLQQWVKELRVLYEAECMNTLQSKSVPREIGRSSSSHSTRDAVQAIQHRAQDVSTEFAKLCQRLEWLELDQVPALAKSLVGHIDTFLRDYTTQWTAADPGLQPQSSLGRQSKVIDQICQRLTEVCSDDQSLCPEDQTVTRQMVQVVTALGHAFTKMVDLMLSREIKAVIQSLEDSSSLKESRDAIVNLTALGTDGGHICRLVARLGGVRALLGICLEPRAGVLRVDALRALATVCCVVEGILELEKAGGVEVVAEVLCDEDRPEEERSEAAGVLAQVTSPWVEDNHALTGLHDNVEAIVNALTNLTRRTKTPETFLLASAALANLTFLDGDCVAAMVSAGTAHALLKAAKGAMGLSIFTKDQIATVLANLSGSRGAAEEVVASGGVSVLLGLLNTRPAPSHRLPEVATAERVQQKSAIALSRLCVRPDVAREVVERGGAERLVRLCKDEEERNHSDAVLVACLAALRKIASTLGPEDLHEMDAAELVEPRLLDSFLIYSSRQESFV